MQIPEFATPKLKRTAKLSSDIAGGPFKKPRLESTSAQTLVSPTPAEKLAMAEGRCQYFTCCIPIIFIVSTHVSVLCFCRRHGRPFS